MICNLRGMWPPWWKKKVPWHKVWSGHGLMFDSDVRLSLPVHLAPPKYREVPALSAKTELIIFDVVPTLIPKTESEWSTAQRRDTAIISLGAWWLSLRLGHFGSTSPLPKSSRLQRTNCSSLSGWLWLLPATMFHFPLLIWTTGKDAVTCSDQVHSAPPTPSKLARTMGCIDCYYDRLQVWRCQVGCCRWGAD